MFSFFRLDSEILAHLNADGRKMYSHLHKFKAQRDQFEEQQKQLMNGISSPQSSVSVSTFDSYFHTKPINFAF